MAHSHSPIIHNAAFRACELNSVYLPFRVPVEDLHDFLQDAVALGVRGLSVTIPHKEAALAKCDRVDGAVKGIGAVNTLMFDEGHITGYNTDYRAAMNCLDLRLNTEERAKPLAGRMALVLGAGGVARAFVFGLLRRGADVVVSSRTVEKAERFAKAMKARHVPWERRQAVKADVIVNATPMGMHPNVDETPFDMHSLRPNTIVFETVYNPEQTLFYKAGKATAMPRDQRRGDVHCAGRSAVPDLHGSRGPHRRDARASPPRHRRCSLRRLTSGRRGCE